MRVSHKLSRYSTSLKVCIAHVQLPNQEDDWQLGALGQFQGIQWLPAEGQVTAQLQNIVLALCAGTAPGLTCRLRQKGCHWAEQNGIGNIWA